MNVLSSLENPTDKDLVQAVTHALSLLRDKKGTKVKIPVFVSSLTKNSVRDLKQEVKNILNMNTLTGENFNLRVNTEHTSRTEKKMTITLTT